MKLKFTGVISRAEFVGMADEKIERQEEKEYH